MRMHLATGRHFNISVMACAVSYTTLPKRCRRSLDVLFLFSCPMSGDCQILCTEYAHRARMARYCLQNLPIWTSLVMETLQRKQRLYHFRVELGNTPVQTPEPSSSAPGEKLVSDETPSPHQTTPHPDKNDALLDFTADPEN